MGTTIAIVYARDQRACCLWVGDSRIYHIRNNTILFESEDHNMGTFLVQNRLAMPNSIEYRSQRHILTQCIRGSHKPAESGYRLFDRLEKGDRILLCSDGMTDFMDDSELLYHLKTPSLKKAANILEAECIERSDDNFTIVLGQVA
jgi:protein phosphatase